MTDPRVQSTIAAIEQRLLRDGFVMRYSTEEVEDALPPGEGAFLACSFWLVDVYMLQEPHTTKPSGCFAGWSRCATTSACSARNTIRSRKRLVGNFPQAFSHLALINSAYNLTGARKPVHQRAQDEHAPPSEEVPERADTPAE